MAKYRITAPHYLGKTLHPAGAIVEWAGRPSRKMVLLDAPKPPPAAPEQRPVTGPTPDSMQPQGSGRKHKAA